ncbi:MMPL family transporter, partial [Candidatus Poribacteria bacterium]|nr:MMPL family transporter [Candidatus Poribacteria bacterium]
MKPLFQIFIRHPKLTILVSLMVTLFFALQLPKLRIETDVDVYLPDGHPAVEYEDLMRETFNYEESLAVAVFNDGPDGIFNPLSLAKIKRMTAEISQAPYVMAEREDDVKSISTMDNIVGTEEGIEVVPLMDEIPTSREEIERLKQNIYDNDMFVGWLVSKDGTAALILAKIEDGQEKQTKAYNEIKKIVAREQGGGDVIYVAGQPVLEATFVDYMVRNMEVMLPIVAVVVILLLYFSFGTLLGVVLPLMVVCAGSIWSLGIMSLMNVPLYDLTTMTPVILVAIGTAYGIHILNRYYEEARDESRRGAARCALTEDHEESRPEAPRNKAGIVLQTMVGIWPPVLMSSLTTAVGFASCYTSSLIPVRSFGIYTGVGILCALLFSVTFIPAGLMLVKMPDSNAPAKRMIDVGGAVQKWSELALGSMGRWVYRRRVAISVLGALLALLSAVGFIKVRANDSWVEMFPHESEVYISNDLICKKMNGTVSVNVVVEGNEPDVIKSPSVLNKICELQELAEQDEGVGGSISIGDYIKRMNKVMNEDREEFNTVPDSREAIAQYLLLYSLSGDPDDFDEVVDYEYRQANITITLKDDHTVIAKRLADRIGRFIEKNFKDEPVKVNLTGYAYVTAVVIDLAVKGMLSSILFS